MIYPYAHLYIHEENLARVDPAARHRQAMRPARPHPVRELVRRVALRWSNRSTSPRPTFTPRAL